MPGQPQLWLGLEPGSYKYLADATLEGANHLRFDCLESRGIFLFMCYDMYGAARSPHKMH